MVYTHSLMYDRQIWTNRKTKGEKRQTVTEDTKAITMKLTELRIRTDMNDTKENNDAIL